MTLDSKLLILGAGVTGLGAGSASGGRIYEASSNIGGICSTYYNMSTIVNKASAAGLGRRTYRFEVGGGHWIFGGEPSILRFIESISPTKTYSRKSGVIIDPERGLIVPFPLQHNLRYLDPSIASTIVRELLVADSIKVSQPMTMKEWLLATFGSTLCEMFFFPFNHAYTAGLYTEISSQFEYKSPLDIQKVITGAFQEPDEDGYNVTFKYPIAGLDQLAYGLAQKCTIELEAKAISIDTPNKTISFENGSFAKYHQLIATIPLDQLVKISGVKVNQRVDPYTSVLVVNVGAKKGPKCPNHHWIYVVGSKSGFHRIGFYSNVDASFLPESLDAKNYISLYVERAFIGGDQPTNDEVKAYVSSVISELKDWGYIDEPDVVDTSWIDHAYTWSWQHSSWAKLAIQMLESIGVFPVGRYARWKFQGIAESIRDGLLVATTLNLSDK